MTFLKSLKLETLKIFTFLSKCCSATLKLHKFKANVSVKKQKTNKQTKFPVQDISDCKTFRSSNYAKLFKIK